MELASEVEAKLKAVLDVSAIRAELAFLRHIDSRPEYFYNEAVIKRAICRLDWELP
jgi:hypothetical protein